MNNWGTMVIMVVLGPPIIGLAIGLLRRAISRRDTARHRQGYVQENNNE